MKLKEIGNIITGKTPSTKDYENFDGDILFITPEDIAKGYCIEKTARYISEKGYSSIKNNTLKRISILVGCIGSDMGNVAISNGKCATNQQINSITNICDNVNPYYLYYILSMKKQYFRQIAGSTTTPILPKSVFENIDVKIVDKNLQDKIAYLLKAIDDKISNNNNITLELEQMAKTIYDYWFLQFEFPNEDGKPYKSSGGKMVWNDELKKEIPEGWTSKKIIEIEDNIVTGKTPSTKDDTNFNGDIPFITIDDIRHGLYISKTVRTLSDKGANSQIKKFIPENSICVTCIATVGLVGITTKNSQTNQQINSIVCKNKNNLYYLVSAINDYFKYSSGAKSGNIFDNMNKEDFASIRLLYPIENILEKYKEEIEPVYTKIKNCIIENEELTKLRDFLLPLLMNGQVSFIN